MKIKKKPKHEDMVYKSIMTREEDIEWCHRTDIKIAREEGYKEGLELARKIVNKKLAKKLLEMNVDIDIIKKATGLSINDINSLKEIENN